MIFERITRVHLTQALAESYAAICPPALGSARADLTLSKNRIRTQFVAANTANTRSMPTTDTSTAIPAISIFRRRASISKQTPRIVIAMPRPGALRFSRSGPILIGSGTEDMYFFKLRRPAGGKAGAANGSTMPFMNWN